MTLSIKGLSVERHNRLIIEDFTATFIDRSITLLEGANGSGKSTLLATLAGDLKPLAGEITLANRDMTSLSSHELSKVRSVLLQRNEFVLAFSVQEILELVAAQAGKRSKVRSLKSLAKELDLQHLLSRSVLELSGGERQRVSLAIALTREVPLYLLDEPLSAQDEDHSKVIATYLSKIALSGSIMVIATHDTAELSAVASQEIRLAHS